MKISGYLHVRNPVEMDYPFEASIRSLFAFCDEIVVCDTSDKEDGTENILKALRADFEGIDKWGNVFTVVRPKNIDWGAPNHGIYDGMCKAIARDACTGDFCFQIDADEVVDATREQMEQMCARLDGDVLLLDLPVVEYWGSQGKVRIDVNPWKWRLSKNHDNITHGIPVQGRVEHDGLLYARPGTDGCDYITKDTGHLIGHLNFMSDKVLRLKQAAETSQAHADAYEEWFNKMTTRLPTIYHFSWWSVYEKMRKYKLFWNNSWQSLYNEQRAPGYNPFFNKPFDQVTEDEMRKTAADLETKTGGWIFHQPWDGTPKLHVKIDKPFPELAKKWCERHKK